MADPKTAKKTNGNGEKTEPDESPEDRFKRVAGKRVGNALRAMDSIASAGKSSIMVNTDEQRTKIVDALRAKVTEVENALQTVKGAKKAKVETFQL